MKKILRRCFGIVAFSLTILSMMSLTGTPAIADIVFNSFGIVCVSLCALSLVGLWIACLVVLIGVVVQVVKAGAGLSTLFQTLIDKVTKNEGEGK